jgi:hypothetical protein
MGEAGVEVVTPGLELGDPVPEFGDAGPCGGVVHGAVLERVVIPVDGGLVVDDFRGDGVEFAVPTGVAVVELAAGLGEDLVDEGVGDGVEVVEGLEYGGADVLVAAVGAGDQPGEVVFAG